MTSTTASAPASPSKALHIGLWVVQILLAVVFAGAGMVKATTPIAELTEKMGWPAMMPEAMVRFIAISELAAVVGLLLPSLTRIKPMLTPLASAGLVVVMVLAIPVHLDRGEFGGAVFNLFLGGLAAFVAWGRTRKAPILPR